MTKYHFSKSNSHMAIHDSSFPFRFLLMSLLIPFGLLTNLPRTHAESPAQIKSEEEIVRKQMVQWSQELGVTCTECHNTKNFKENSFKAFRVGQEHAKIVSIMKENGFDGIKGPLANCYMCHRGTLRPPSQEPHKK